MISEKKTWIFLIAVLLVVSCLFTGCDEVSGNDGDETGQGTTMETNSKNDETDAPEPSDNGEESTDKVTIAVPTLELTVGKKPDFKEHVTVSVNGSPVKNPEIEWTLKSGDESKVGRCIYEITYVWNGVTYRKNGFVNFTADPDKPIETPEIPVGDKTMSAAEKQALNAMLAKEYESYIFEYEYRESAKPEYYEYEKNTVRLNNVWIEYKDVNYSETAEDHLEVTEFNWYISEQQDGAYYIFFNADTGKWNYLFYTTEQYVTNTNIQPYAFVMANCNLDADKFVKVSENTYSVKTEGTALYLVADAVFGLGDDTEYKSIILTTDGQNIIGIKGTYTDVASNGDTYEATVEYKWSGFDTTSLTVPDADEYVPPREPAPDHLAPEAGEALNDEQKNAFDSAVSADDSNLSYGYTDERGSSNMQITVGGQKDGDRYSETIREVAAIDGVEKWSAEYRYVWLPAQDGSTHAYAFYGSFNDWIYSLEEGNPGDFCRYLSLKKMGLTSSLFGYAEGKYVVKPEALESLTGLLKAYLGVDSEFSYFELITFTVSVDSDNHITGWSMLAYGTSNRSSFYWNLNYSYSGWGTDVTVKNPAVGTLSDLNAEQEEEIRNALSADLSNVTIQDSYTSSEMYFDGAWSKHTGMEGFEEYEDIFVCENGIYYKVLGSEKVAIDTEGVNGYINEMLVFDFSSLDPGKFRYDAELGVYVIAGSEVSLQQFAYYWSDFADYVEYLNEVLGTSYTFEEFDYFTFEVVDGKISQIRAVCGLVTISATFTDYGTTSVAPQA